MRRTRRVIRRWIVGGVAASFAALVLLGCARAPMSTTLPPLIEERVPGAYDVEFRAGTTASAGLQTINVSFMLDRKPVTADDLAAVIGVIYETNSLGSVYTVGVAVYTSEADDGFECVDLTSALNELDLSDSAFMPFECARLLADFDDLEEWWTNRTPGE